MCTLWAISLLQLKGLDGVYTWYMTICTNPPATIKIIVYLVHSIQAIYQNMLKERMWSQMW